MNHAMQIRLRPAEGSVLRTMGLAERRGFRLVSANLHHAVGGCQVLSMVLHSPTRSIDTLQRQLERLHDVLEARVIASDSLPTADEAQPALALVGN